MGAEAQKTGPGGGGDTWQGPKLNKQSISQISFGEIVVEINPSESVEGDF